MVLTPLFDAYGNQFVEFREDLFKSANRYIGYQITPDENNAYIISGHSASSKGYFPVFQYIGRLHFYRMQMAGPASDAFSENPYQGYWDLETSYYLNQPVYIPDPNGKIIRAIYEAGNNIQNNGVYRRSHSPTDKCSTCNILGGKRKKQKSKTRNIIKKRSTKKSRRNTKKNR